jgi:Ca-activated chloride channel family protein
MSATDVAPSRLEAARRAAESFLDEVPDELLVGFVGYATSTESVLEPTRDRDAVRATLGALQADGGTATGDALGAALDRLEARKGRDGRVAPAAIVLLSDGKTTQGGDPLEAAARARQLGVPVYTVALGTPDGVLPNGPMGQAVPVPPDPETLRAIAERSGGQAFEVEDAGELEGIYERLGSQIGTREEQREISAGFAAAGLLLLLGGVGTGLRWRGRLP